MRAVVTGANGFIGAELARALLAPGSDLAISRLVLTDRAASRFAWRDPRVEFRIGDIADPGFARSLVENAGTVFHLAGVVSGAAEADFDLGMRVNLEGTRNVLEACRAQSGPVCLVFASSIAVYGVPLPPAIDDDTPSLPTLSYGTQKLVCEQLIHDYTRKGFLEGRALRLPGIVVRPRLPNGALSAFASDIIREPLAGNDYVCPVSPAGVTWKMSAARCAANLIHASRAPARDWDARRGLLLPALAVSMAEIVDALERAAGSAVRKRVRFAPDAALERQFAGWPRELHARRALALGFRADESLDRIVADHLAAVKAGACAA